MRAAVRDRSPLAFYLIAAATLFFCSLGPEPTLLGWRILYEPPYAWLMRLPFFDDTIRVPARFGMLAVLALSLAGSLAYARLAAARPGARWLPALVIAGILADGAMRPLPLAAPPGSFTIPREAAAADAVLELPLGDVIRDTAAMYRVTMHGTRTVNGYNGYDPLYYHVLRLSLAGRDATALDALTARGSILVAIASTAPDAQGWRDFVSSQPAGRRLADQPGWSFFLLPRRQAPVTGPCSAEPVGITTAAFDGSPIPRGLISDADPATRWISPAPQRRGNTLMLSLDRAASLCGIEISRAAEGELYPRALEIATSLDGTTWQVAFTGALGGAAMDAVLEHPLDARLRFDLAAAPARFVRLRLLKSDPIYQWAVADVIVRGAP
jgi:hypothetical protein